MKFTILENPHVEVKPVPGKPLSFMMKIYLPEIEMSMDAKPDNIAFLMKNIEVAMLAAVKMTNDKEVEIEDISGGG